MFSPVCREQYLRLAFKGNQSYVHRICTATTKTGLYEMPQSNHIGSMTSTSFTQFINLFFIKFVFQLSVDPAIALYFVHGRCKVVRVAEWLRKIKKLPRRLQCFFVFMSRARSRNKKTVSV